MLCMLFGYRPEAFAAELVVRTIRYWWFSGANGASARNFVISRYRICYSISS